MLLTNALLSVAFSVIGHFNTLVEIPHGAVPRSVADLTYFNIPPTRPLDVFLVDRRGTQFWLHNGALSGFRTVRGTNFFG